MNQNNNQTHSAHWIDKLANGILKWQEKNNIKQLHVDDMKTPSGRVHTGALKGVLLHDMVAKALAEKTNNVVSTYVFNSMDPMDGLPNYLNKAEYEQHMGKSMHQIPAPNLDNCGIDLSKASQEELADFKNANSFAQFYAFDFIHAFRKLGCEQQIVWSHKLYESGQMDAVIREALDNVEKFRKIYKEVADYDLPENWYPFQVICPECGKLGTTLVTDWDGAQVTYECQENKVEWAKGCGHRGQISPFGGSGKLLWKVDWPAHWKVMGVNIEGAGKDHTSAGGSRDMADAICETIFKIQKPFDIPYEWILIRGAKMSSSKGVGTSAREFTELFPAEIGRFLFANKHYNSVIDFDPNSMSIPDLFDEYDLAAKIYWGQAQGDERLGRAFEISQIGNIPEPHFLPRFRDIALWMQDPAVELISKFAEIKGSDLSQQELDLLTERKTYAQKWVDAYAPEEFQLTVKAELPEQANKLTQSQKEFLVKINNLVDSKENWDAQELQQEIFDLAKSTLGAKQGFQAIYLAFLGKTSGPKAAWFLLSIDKGLRGERVEQILHLAEKVREQIEHLFPDFKDKNFFSIQEKLAQTYPSVTVGLAVIKGITVNKNHEELEAEKQAFIEKNKFLDNQSIENYPEIKSYRELHRNMKVNWHERRSSPAALLRRIAQGNGTTAINTCVDTYNLAVLKNRVSVGAFNLDEIKLPTQIKIAQGGEEILLLGDDKPTILKAGEISYFDQIGPYNLDFNYRDAQRTAVDENTKNILLNVEGVFDISREQVEKTLQDSIDLILKYCGGRVEFAGIVEASKASN